MDWTAMLQQMLVNFPVFGGLVVGWLLAEQRARRWERRYVALTREAMDLPPEDITNGGE